MKKYLVIGAGGFIGANVMRTLINKGYSTVGVVENDYNIWRIESFLFKNKIYSSNFADVSTIRRIIRSEKPDKIFFCQDYGSQPYHNREEKIFFLNIQNLRLWLKELTEVGFESFVAIGSHQEYGVDQDISLTEDHLLKPVADYGVVKASATHILLKEAHRKNLPIYVVRPFNLIGEYFASNSLLSGLINLALGKKYFFSDQIPLKADFLYIEDFVNALITISVFRPKGQNIFNVGSGKSVSTVDFFDLLSSELGKMTKKTTNLRNDFLSKVTSHQLEGYSDISKISSLGWNPNHNLAEGVKEVCSWWKKFNKIKIEEDINL